MTIFQDDVFDIRSQFAELTFLEVTGGRELVVLLFDDRPVAMSNRGHRIVLSTDLDDYEEVAKHIIWHWAEELEQEEVYITLERESPAGLEGMIYAYLRAFERPLSLLMGADISHQAVVEVSLRFGLRLLFNDTTLLAVSIPGQRVFVSHEAPPRSMLRIASWAKNLRQSMVQIGHHALMDIVGRHLPEMTAVN